jgi:hypothetical protein
VFPKQALADVCLRTPPALVGLHRRHEVPATLFVSPSPGEEPLP